MCLYARTCGCGARAREHAGGREQIAGAAERTQGRLCMVCGGVSAFSYTIHMHSLLEQVRVHRCFMCVS